MMLYTVLIYGLCGGSLFLLSMLLMLNLPGVNRKANIFLGICSFFLASIFIQLFLESADIQDLHYALPFLELGRWAILPSLFVAVNLYISPERYDGRHLIHFLPTLVLFILLSFSGLFTLPFLFVFIIRYFIYFQLLLYGFWSYVLLQRHQYALEQFSSYTNGIDLSWLEKLLYAVLALGILNMVTRLFPVLSSVMDGLYLVTVIYFSYYALSQKTIYPVKDEEVPLIKQAIMSKDKERLTSEQVQVLKDRLSTLMEDEKPYLDPTLSLPALAEEIGLSVHELSYVLNTGVGVHFYQFINGYRIAHAQRLLKEIDNNGYSIQEISIRSGFNSKTTFYTSFKQVAGTTPKQFLQQQEH